MARDPAPNARPSPQYGIAQITLPTPNVVSDVLIVEEENFSAETWRAMLPGTPRPDDPTALLLLERIITKNDHRQAVQRIYATARDSSQNAYNDDLDYDQNDKDYPIYVRELYTLRSDYVAIARGTRLTSIVRVKVTAGGTGYPDTSTASVTGGSGTGAMVGLEIRKGVVVAAIIVNGGDGYTTVPTITITGTGGAGATAVAFIQEAACVLTQQRRTRVDGELSSLFVRERRVYESLPGAQKVDSVRYESESGSFITTTRRKKMASAITEGVSHDSDESATIVTSEGIDGFVAWEVTTVYPKSPYHSEATAYEEFQMLPYNFPRVLLDYGRAPVSTGPTYTSADFFGTVVGIRSASSQTTLHKFLTWFVIGATIPELIFSEITPDDIVLNNVTINNVLHNDLYRFFPTGVVKYYATSPSADDYYGTTDSLIDGDEVNPPVDPFKPGAGTKWVGTERKVKGSVRRAGMEYRWKCEAVIVTMK